MLLWAFYFHKCLLIQIGSFWVSVWPLTFDTWPRPVPPGHSDECHRFGRYGDHQPLLVAPMSKSLNWMGFVCESLCDPLTFDPPQTCSTRPSWWVAVTWPVWRLSTHSGGPTSTRSSWAVCLTATLVTRTCCCSVCVTTAAGHGRMSSLRRRSSSPTWVKPRLFHFQPPLVALLVIIIRACYLDLQDFTDFLNL